MRVIGALLLGLVSCSSPARSSESATDCLPERNMAFVTECRFKVRASERINRGMSPYDEINKVRDYSFIVTNIAGFAHSQCLVLLYEQRQRLVIDQCEPGDRTILFRVGVEELK